MRCVFTAHAEARLVSRKLTKDEVLKAIKYPDITLKKHGKYYAQKRLDRGKIEVVHEKTKKYIKIITLYWL